MALVLRDRVKETTTTTGTGTITLAGAVAGFQSFSVIGNANTTYYAIVGGAEFEVGIGTYTSSGTTLSRDTVLTSSNSGSKVDFSAGEKDVFCTQPADKAVFKDASDDIVVSGTVDGRDVAADGTTADAALPKAGGTMTGALNFGDNLNINFGAGSDLNLSHNNSYGNIIDTNDKTLNMVCDTGGTISINNGVFSSGFKSAAVFDPDGGQFIRHDGSTKLQTSSTGITVTGGVAADNITVSGSVIFEGATADAHETTLAVTDPTADRTITLPNATGTVILNTNLNFPFFKADGSSDTIALTADNKLPFIKSDGSASNIALTT